MKLGFSIKKQKKNALITHDSNSLNGEKKLSSVFGTIQKEETAPVKHFVSDFNANLPVSTKKEIIIPLIKTNEWKKEKEQQTNDSTKEQFTQDEIAAQAILEEARKAQNPDQKSSSSSGSSTLIISMIDKLPPTTSTKQNKKQQQEEDEAKRQKKEALFALKKNDDTKPNAAPILRQNVVPGMDELEDVTKKYRHDVSLRPDALDVHSEVYQVIPVEEFGSALLRGMGWKGPSNDKDNDKKNKGFDIKPRHKLLGLGATVNPTFINQKKKKKHRDNQENPLPRQMGLNKPEPSKESFQRNKQSEEKEKYADDKKNRDKFRDHSRQRDHSRSKQRDRDRVRTDRKRSRSPDRSRDRSERSDRKRYKSRRSRSRSRGRDRDRR